MVSESKVKFTVLGTGNSGQTFAADLSLKGYSVNLAELPQFKANLDAIEEKGGIEISGESSRGFAKLNMITTDLAKAIKNVDVIIIGGSAHAHEPFARALARHFEDGQFVLMVSNFGALRFRKIMKEMGIKAEVVPVESISLLYATRAVKPGEVVVTGLKDKLPLAALPASKTGEFLEKTSQIYPQFTAADNVLFTSLNNLNPIVHPPLVLFNAGRIESAGGKGWSLFADGASESVVKVMLAMDQERLSLLNRMRVTGRSIKDAFGSFYESYSLSKESFSETLRKSQIHSNSAFPPPSTIDTRYINEDVPFGLVPWSFMSRMWGIPTPNINAVIQVASAMPDKDYFVHGLTVKDLGVEHFSPEELRRWIS